MFSRPLVFFKNAAGPSQPARTLIRQGLNDLSHVMRVLCQRASDVEIGTLIVPNLRGVMAEYIGFDGPDQIKKLGTPETAILNDFDVVSE